MLVIESNECNRSDSDAGMMENKVVSLKEDTIRNSSAVSGGTCENKVIKTEDDEATISESIPADSLENERYMIYKNANISRADSHLKHCRNDDWDPNTSSVNDESNGPTTCFNEAFRNEDFNRQQNDHQINKVYNSEEQASQSYSNSLLLQHEDFDQFDTDAEIRTSRLPPCAKMMHLLNAASKSPEPTEYDTKSRNYPHFLLNNVYMRTQWPSYSTHVETMHHTSYQQEHRRQFYTDLSGQSWLGSSYSPKENIMDSSMQHNAIAVRSLLKETNTDQQRKRNSNHLDNLKEDLDSQTDPELLRVERKRQRNRIAARKCRTKKLERIAELEAKVKELSAQNRELENEAIQLKLQIYQLRELLVQHHKSGECDSRKQIPNFNDLTNETTSADLL